MPKPTKLRSTTHAARAAQAAPSTRERILAHLKENRTTSAVDLAYAWGLTRADLRYHLGQLLKEGRIEPAPRDPEMGLGPGRPVIRYRLAQSPDLQPLTRLLRALIEEVVCPRPAEDRHALPAALARHMAGAMPEPEAGALTRRLTQAVAWLNQSAYHARWEAHALGPRILLRRCPYASILDTFPELCQVDRQLLEALTGARARQAARMNFETGQPPACIFQILHGEAVEGEMENSIVNKITLPIDNR